MSTPDIASSRRTVLGGLVAAALAWPSWRASAQGASVIDLRNLGLPSGADATSAIQGALDRLARQGGGTLRIGGRFRAGLLVVRGSDIAIEGDGGVLLDSRLTIAPGAERIAVRNLTLLETRGDPASYLIDVSGRDVTFEDVSLVKRPMAGGYQGYVRAPSANCVFRRLKLEGSNGIFVAGRNHLFEGFDFTSTLRRDMGGDDAFAIKGAGSETSDIVIRDGVVRGFAAAVSIGSEVGSSPDHPGRGAVRRVSVSNVTADRCQSLCLIKPGALIYDWRNGVVEDILLDSLRLTDPQGFLFARGLAISAARGAHIRRVTARNIVIEARAHTQGVMPTAAVDITIRTDRPAAVIEDLDLQLAFDGRGAAGYPVDQIVRIEKDDPGIGTMRNIAIDVTGAGARIAGILVGAGLDDVVHIRRARLADVALDPPSSLGAAGIWADSRLRTGDVQIDAVRAPPRGGRAR